MTSMRKALSYWMSDADPGSPVTRQDVERIREELGVGFLSMDSDDLPFVADLLDALDEEQVLAWLAERAQTSSPEFKADAAAIKGFFAKAAANTAKEGCTRRPKRPACPDYGFTALTDATCRLGTRCPYPVPPKVPKPKAAGEAFEPEGFDFEWE